MTDTEKLIVKNGLVYDPLNGIKGENKDVLIEDGLIVENFSSQNDLKEIDVSGKTVIPAALDIHSHISSQQVNWARLLGSKNKIFINTWKRLTLETIARDYISNGYTFVLDAKVYPSLSRQAILNFSHLPVLDTGMLLNVSNLWALEDEYQRGKIEELSYFLSDLLSTCKGFGFKVYNPFEAETWNFKILRESIEQKGKLYNFTPLDVYKALTNANEVLKLPHSLHAHIEGYEDKVGMNNLKIILDNIDFESIKKKQKNPMERDQVIHLAHANAYGLEGDTSELIEILNSNNDIDLDLGMIGFDKINPIITSDRRLATKLMEGQENNYKFIRSANEFEGDSFIGFRKFDKDDPTHCTLWANAIELALNLKNKWQVQLSFNYPHYSHINNLPTFASLLMSHSMRQDFMKDMNDGFLKQTPLNGNEKIINFNEFIIITRASPAKSLGLAKIKGSLAPGADGDLNILNVDMNQIDPSKDYDQLENALRDIEYTIKNGQIIKKGNKIDLERKGKIFWTEGVVDKNTRLEFMKKKKIFYQKYYSIFYESLENSVKGKFLRKI